MFADIKRAESMKAEMKKPKRTPSFTTRRRTQSFRKLQQLDQLDQLPPVEIHGTLDRKHELQSAGKKAPVRSWKTYYTGKKLVSWLILLCWQEPLLVFMKHFHCGSWNFLSVHLPHDDFFLHLVVWRCIKCEWKNFFSKFSCLNLVCPMIHGIGMFLLIISWYFVFYLLFVCSILYWVAYPDVFLVCCVSIVYCQCLKI